MKHSRGRARRQQTAERLIYALMKARRNAEVNRQSQIECAVFGSAAIHIDRDGKATAIDLFDAEKPAMTVVDDGRTG